jgi:CheY-like chemotaxis protein
MLIDDDIEDQEIFLEAIEQAGIAVNCTTLENAKEALHKLLGKDLAVDLIFLDLNMPIMSGSQFLAEIKKLDSLKDIPVIILSTSSDSNTIQQTKQLGATKFITKPETFDELVFVLKAVLN